MPEALKEGYKKVAADPSGLQVMHDRDAKRMVNFKDIPMSKSNPSKPQRLSLLATRML
jgi:hypothetical protein